MTNEGQEQAVAQYASICGMLADLDDAEDSDDEDGARQRIADHPYRDWEKIGRAHV